MTLEDAQDWAKAVVKQRYAWVEILFGKDKAKTAADQFCQACRRAKKNRDCKTCSKNIEIRGGMTGSNMN